MTAANTPPSGKVSSHPLEKIVETGPGEEKDRRLHSALLLGFYGAMREVVGQNILTTPLYGIDYDTSNHHLNFEEYEGFAPVPSPNKSAYTCSTLDLIFACHNRDMPLIFEGDTGVGKTVTTEAYLKTVLPEESSVIMSLSQQSLMDSPKSPFERSTIEGGMPTTHLDREKMRKIAAMYIDESNLGNPNDLLQLSQGRVLLSKERGIAGLLIPKLTSSGVVYSEEELKRLWFSGSQNPSKAKDAQFSGIELPASMKNRCLILGFPKIVKSVGSTMWLVDRTNGQHHRFLESLVERYEQLSGQKLSPEVQKGIGEEWLSIFAYIMDGRRTEKAIIHSTLEFGDAVMMVLSGELTQSYEQEKQVTKNWSERLPANLGTNLIMKGGALSETQEVKQVNTVVGSFNKPLTERDDAHLKNLADLLATIKSVRRAYQHKERGPLENYLRTSPYITVEDVAAAATLLAKNKQIEEKGNPLDVINTLLKEYSGMMDDLARKMKVTNYRKFEVDNFDQGIKNIIYGAALLKAKNCEDIVSHINDHVGELQSLVSSSEMRKIIAVRVIADLATASYFIYEHREEINRFMKSKEANPLAVRKYVKGLYEREAKDPTLPDSYQHRLPRVL